MRCVILLSLLLLGCSSEPDPPQLVPNVIPRPPIQTSFSLSWAEAVMAGEIQTRKASKSNYMGEANVPSFGLIVFHYSNPHPAVDMSGWAANKAPIFRGGFNPPNAVLSYIRLLANAGPPFERFQLVLPQAVTTMTFPLYDFDERGAVLSLNTPEEPGTTYSLSGGKDWSLDGNALRYRGDRKDGQEHLPKNVAIITVSNPMGFTALEIGTSGRVGVGIGDLEMDK